MADTGDPRVPSGTAVLTVDGASLRRVGARPGLARYLASLWEYRSFILFDSRSRIAGANSVNALGRVWMVLNPILDGAAIAAAPVAARAARAGCSASTSPTCASRRT